MVCSHALEVQGVVCALALEVQGTLRQLVLERRACSRLSGTEIFSSKLQPFQLPGPFASIWPRLQRAVDRYHPRTAQAGCPPRRPRGQVWAARP